jgi:hypothetical protein
MKGTGLLLVVLAAVAVGAACDELESSALTVNGEDISQSSVDDDLRALRDNDQFAEALGQSPAGELARSPGTINSSYTADWLTLLVQSTVVDQEIERRDVEVTDADRRQAEEQAQEQSFGSPAVFDGFPQWFQDDFVARLAAFLALENDGVDQEGFTRLLMDADVDVDPRYGRWSKEDGAVVPPART